MLFSFKNPVNPGMFCNVRECDRHYTKVNKPVPHTRDGGYMSTTMRFLMSSLEAEYKIMYLKLGKVRKGNYSLNEISISVFQVEKSSEIWSQDNVYTLSTA